jgi:hypothetical protein
MPVILATQVEEIRRITTESQPRVNSSVKNYLEKPFTKAGLMEWLKMKALSSSPSITQKDSYTGSFIVKLPCLYVLLIDLVHLLYFSSFYLSPFL